MLLAVTEPTSENILAMNSSERYTSNQRVLSCFKKSLIFESNLPANCIVKHVVRRDISGVDTFR